MSSLLLMTIAKIWQMAQQIVILPILWQFQDLILSLVIGFTIVLLCIILYKIWPLYHQSVDSYLQAMLEPLQWGDLIWLALLPATSEEFLFRGVMLEAFGSDMIAVIFSSLIFGILHLRSYQHWPYFLMATLISIVLGYVTLITGNLLVPIIIHLLINLSSCIFWKFNKLKTV